jgi:ABC-type Fe3+-hydroxamate transport system substrate-binding protein
MLLTTNDKKPVNRWLFLLTAVFSLLSCSTNNTPSEPTTAVRIITLAPHLAELAASAGALDNLVGVVAYSDFPAEVKHIQIIGDAFNLDYEAIVALNPDYLIAWKGGTPIATINKLKSLKLNLIETEITELSDIPATIELIAELTNTKDIATNNIKRFNQKLNQLKKPSQTFKTLFIQSYSKPLYTVSGKHWISEAAAICGYQNIFNDLSQISTTVSLESVIAKNPQAILNIANQIDQQWQSWPLLDAVKNKQIFTISPDYFARPSMRILNGIAQLCDS